MLVKFWSLRTALCLALFLRIEAELSVEKNAYQNVVVSFSSKLPPEDGISLVDSMQKIFNEASSVLHTAVGLRIGSVTFHLPRTWNSSHWSNVGSVSSYNAKTEPEIQVTSLTDSAFGKQPIAHQYGGCGVSALGISIPSEFLLAEEESFPKGKTLAREWLKYRYGVFDENGFLDDPMYPTHYTIPGSDEIHITDCTSPKIGYSIMDSQNNSCVLTSETANNCSIHPHEEDVTSSLMFYHEKLPQLDHVCGKEDRIHNVGSPNKQNLICSYKSIWEVIETSEDFKSVQADDEVTDEEIKFSFVQESELRLAVAWQDTKSLLTQGRTILKVVQKLMFDIPDGSRVALYSFKDTLNEHVPFREITETTRTSWATNSNFGSTVDGQPLLAVHKAVNDMQANDEADKPGIIVLFTNSNPAEDADLVEKLKNSKLCLYVIGLPGISEEAWSAFLDASSCSSLLQITDSSISDAVETYKNLYSAVQSILPGRDDSKIHTVSTSMLPHEEKMSIPTDLTAKKFTVWIFHTVEFECFVNQTAIALTAGVQSSFLVSYSFEPQNDTVECRLKDIPEGSYLVHVQVTTEGGESFNNKVWFQDTTPSDSEEQMPYIIYAKISYGEYPVRDADVRAEVLSPSGDKVILTLGDDGRGDPDVTQYDGIYSKYFTKLDSQGTYQVTITATGKANASKNGQDLCCGSAIVSDSFELTELKWTEQTSFTVSKNKSKDGYKPSRVTDLRVESLNLPDSLTLKWTAPGGEMDEGKASNYQFLLFCQLQDCRDGILPNWISFPNKIEKPKDSGKDEAVKVEFYQGKPDNITVYLTLKTENHNHQFSEESNRVYIKLTPNDPQETTTSIITEDDSKGFRGPTAGSIVAYVIIGLAILMLICGIVYFLLDRTRRGRALEELNTPAAFMSVDSSGEIFSFKNVAPPAENPIRRAESIPVVLYTHDQIKDFKNKTKQPPLYRSDVEPKPWVSLNALTDRNGSSSSNSTINVGDGKTQSGEIRQLNDMTTIPLRDKNSRF
ncbi:calcium-activated chloride channel regulator 1 isoform X1 [Parasteatoda tepidariorum]|uniref:calcium-activated chloride channel regulator 1 isoform X1 n=1 Tax=Parasteatoda tepidariorum TaxID=114398 RepID=UPI0039BD3E84